MRTRVIVVLTILFFAAIAMVLGGQENDRFPTPEGTVSVAGERPNLGMVFVPGSGAIFPEPREKLLTIAPPSRPLNIVWVASAAREDRDIAHGIEPMVWKAVPAAESARVASADESRQVPEEPPVAAPEGEAGEAAGEKAVPEPGTVAQATPVAEPAKSSPAPEPAPAAEAGKLYPIHKLASAAQSAQVPIPGPVPKIPLAVAPGAGSVERSGVQPNVGLGIVSSIGLLSDAGVSSAVGAGVIASSGSGAESARPFPAPEASPDAEAGKLYPIHKLASAAQSAQVPIPGPVPKIPLAVAPGAGSVERSGVQPSVGLGIISSIGSLSMAEVSSAIGAGIVPFSVGVAGVSGPVAIAQATPVAEPAKSSPAPEPGPAAEAEKPAPAPEATPAAETAQASPAGEEPQGQEEPAAAATEGEAEEAVKEEAVPGVETAPPPAPPVTRTPYPRRFVSPGTAPSPGVPAPRAAGNGFLVKFNNADLYEVIHTLGRMAGINYLIDPRVRGVVNVHTQGTVNKEGALELLFSILKVNGATAVREGEIYHIVPVGEAKMGPLVPEEWKEKKGAPSSNRPVISAFPIRFTVAAEMAKLIKPFVSAGGDVTEIPGANMVLVLDTAANMEKHARLVELFDRDLGTSRLVYLYRVRHGKVQDVMNIINKLFPGKAAAVPGKQTEFKPKVAEPVVKAVAAVERKEERPAAGHQEGGAKEGGFDIIPDEPTNSIIIRGSPAEYAALLNVLKVIDVYPHQVLLEVLIAEVKLDDELKLGVDWKYMSRSSEWSHEVSLSTSAAGISQGLAYAFEKTDRLLGSVRALADDGKVSILSSPSVISTNGKQSKVQVAEQVPVTSGQVTNVAGTADVITETVVYRDVGIILTFTPYINDEGLVTLEIDQEVSEVAGGTGGPLNNPTFIKRSIQTTLLASKDRSIVLGGLVRERRERSRDGIPFLYKIPVFGWIFGARNASVSRTELLIFITPRVIESVEEGTQLSREFEDRVDELKRRISEAEGMKPPLKEPQAPYRP